jgi:hypothetical protein
VVFRGKEKTENYVLMISLDNQISFFIVDFIYTRALLSALSEEEGVSIRSKCIERDRKSEDIIRERRRILNTNTSKNDPSGRLSFGTKLIQRV